jgi:cyclopropane fatty-acyl-phospholipid synthase-like methyltransferase
MLGFKIITEPGARIPDCTEDFCLSAFREASIVNISREQLGFAQKTCTDLPVRFMDCDYRAIRGAFDKIVSVGMFEHVGRKNYRTFMKTVHRCLNDTGIFLLHTIGSDRSQVHCDPWINRLYLPQRHAAQRRANRPSC